MRQEERTLSVSGNFSHQATGPKNVAAGIDFCDVRACLYISQNREAEATLPAFPLLGLKGAAWPASPAHFLFSSASACPRTIASAGYDWYSRLLYTSLSLTIPFPFPGTQRQTVLLPLPQVMGLAKIKPNDSGI